MNDPGITQLEADKWFVQILQRDFWKPLQATPDWSQMGDSLRSALLSFAFNTGYRYGAEGFDTLNGVLKLRNWNNLPRVLILYRNPGSPSELGLARRRYCEILLSRGVTAVNAREKAFLMQSVADVLRVIAE